MKRLKITTEERSLPWNTRTIDISNAVVRLYKTRDSEESISRRTINLKDIRYYHNLLGHYTVVLNCEYIGINTNFTNTQRVSAMAHELRYALFDQKQLEAALPFRCSTAYRSIKYQELLQEFQYAHSRLLTPDEIALINSIEKHFVDFKLNILAEKGYQLPFLPELLPPCHYCAFLPLSALTVRNLTSINCFALHLIIVSPSASVDTRIMDCVDDIDLDFVREYTAKIGYGKGPLEYLRGNKDFIVTRNGQKEISGAAILLFGKNPQHFLQRARVRFIRYEGTEA